jgi:cobalt-zinc-cadmium efflux system protein
MASDTPNHSKQKSRPPGQSTANECNHEPNHHDHNHTHHGQNKSFNALLLAFLLNLGFCVIEAVGGFYASSQAIMADALHDFGDSLSLLTLLGLKWVAMQPSSEAYSFGYRRLNIIGAALVGGSLIFGCVVILGQSLPKLLNPGPVNSELMLGLAILGIAVNGLAFYRLRSHGGVSENLISLHLLEDLWGWVIVSVGAFAIKLYAWYWLDPLLSVFLAFFILWRSFGQLRELGRLFLLGSSIDFSAAKVAEILKQIPEVLSAHHVHVWELDVGFHIVSAHLVVPENADVVAIKQQIRARLLKLGHCEVTLELEKDGEICLDPAHPSDF